MSYLWRQVGVNLSVGILCVFVMMVIYVRQLQNIIADLLVCMCKK